MDEVLSVHDLSVAFQSLDQCLSAVRQVSFELQPGKTLALLGESGCGKTITSLAMMRLLPSTAKYGADAQIMFENQDLLLLPEQVMQQIRGKRLAMIFQEPMTALNPVLSIGQQLREALPEKIINQGRRAVKERMLALLEEVEIPQPELRLRQYPHQLSGGQKQRVVIAMALAGRPEILIADEPTTALDVTIQAQILDLLRRLQKRHHMSMLLITHDLAVVKAVADRVCVMYAGEIVEEADVELFFSRVKHPYVQQLLASLPSFDQRGNKLSVISGAVPSLSHLPQGCSFHPRCQYAFDRCIHEAPELQVVDGRSVRCHLYPEHERLPVLEPGKVEQIRINEQAQDTILEVENLKIYFKQRHGHLHLQTETIKAVDGLSFQLKRAQTLALVGESGCGKTTVSRGLMRLLPVSGGRVHFEGQDVLTLRGRALKAYRKKVQLIFQDPFSAMNPRMTVGEIISEGMQGRGLSRTAIINQQKLLLEQVNLSQNSLSRYPHQFSGGQRQRICIARALAMEPELLICDEPTSALDVSVQAQILNLLKELQAERGLSYLFITHNMAVVAYMADEVMVMKEGKILESGESSQILKHPQHAYTKQLLSAVLEV